MAENNESSNPIEEGAEKVTKSIGLFEKMGCCCLNLGCLLIVLINLSIIAMIVKAVSNPMETLGAILSGIWSAFTGS